MLKDNLEKLMDIVLKLDGDKIITLNNMILGQCEQYILYEEKKKGQELIFKIKLINLMQQSGSIVIRQKTKLKIEGNYICKIYGIALINEDWFPISAKEMETAYCTDYKTGKRLPKDKQVVFDTIKKP